MNKITVSKKNVLFICRSVHAELDIRAGYQSWISELEREREREREGEGEGEGGRE